MTPMGVVAMGTSPSYCCNQRAGAVTVFRMDRATGTLSFTGHYAPVGNPSIVVFVEFT